MNKEIRLLVLTVTNLLVFVISLRWLMGRYDETEDQIAKQLILIQCWLCGILWMMVIQFTFWNHKE